MTLAEVREAIDANVPPHLREGLYAHVAHGQRTGGFLRAVLENDFARAVVGADPISLKLLPAIARVLMNDAPAACWGSPQKVDAWQARGGLQGTRHGALL